MALQLILYVFNYVTSFSWFTLFLITAACNFLLFIVIFKIHFGITPRCQSKNRLFGKTVIITGGNAGIGRETALDLAQRGARVILACRSPLRAEPVVKEIREKSGNYNVEYRHLDLADLESVRRFAEDFRKNEPRLDVLINNGGRGDTGSKYDVSKQNYDLVFATNYLGSFLLTYLLTDLLKLSPTAKIINVSSTLHTFVKKPLNFKYAVTPEGKIHPSLSGYNKSKLANIMHARELTKKLTGTSVTANSLHPGWVNSDIWEPLRTKIPLPLFNFYKTFMKYLCLDNKAGAQTTIFLAVDDSVNSISGKYFVKNAVASCNKLAMDDEACAQLWDLSMKMCGL